MSLLLLQIDFLHTSMWMCNCHGYTNFALTAKIIFIASVRFFSLCVLLVYLLYSVYLIEYCVFFSFLASLVRPYLLLEVITMNLPFSLIDAFKARSIKYRSHYKFIDLHSTEPANFEEYLFLFWSENESIIIVYNNFCNLFKLSHLCYKNRIA